MNSKREGPSLAKARTLPLVERKQLQWIRCTDYHWKDLFDRADLVSEGAVRTDSEGSTYFGSTHIHLCDTSLPISTSTSDKADFYRLIQMDPHVRLRAVRMACLEATIRSNTAFSSIHTEVSFTEVPGAIRISVDLEAHLAEDHARTVRHASASRKRNK